MTYYTTEGIHWYYAVKKILVKKYKGKELEERDQRLKKLIKKHFGIEI